MAVRPPGRLTSTSRSGVEPPACYSPDAVHRQHPGSAALLGLTSLLLLGQAPAPPAPPEGPPAFSLPAPVVAKHLAGFGFSVTTGAAPGYVDERSCALCHLKIAESYR